MGLAAPSPSLAQYSILFCNSSSCCTGLRSGNRRLVLLQQFSIYIPSLPHSPSTFDALLLNYTVTALTISAHHLYLIGDSSRVNPLAFLWLFASLFQTRIYTDLSNAVSNGEAKFFVWVAPFSFQYVLCCRPRPSLNGSTSGSAPHSLASKMQSRHPVPTCVSQQTHAT